MEIVKIRKDVVPDQRAHELVVVDQVDAQHRPGDAVDCRAEEIRPRQEVKEQRDGQRNRQDHGQAGRFLQEAILMQHAAKAPPHQAPVSMRARAGPSRGNSAGSVYAAPSSAAMHHAAADNRQWHRQRRRTGLAHSRRTSQS